MMTIRLIKITKLSFFFLLAMTGIAGADTIVGGDIIINTTWTVAGSPYIVTSTVRVGYFSAPTLTIEAGVTVKFQANKSLSVGYLNVFSEPQPGKLMILGTAASPVILTADSPSPTAGFWNGIGLSTLTQMPTSIQYAQIEYAKDGISVNTVSPEIHSCTFRNNSLTGIKTSVALS